MNQSQRLQQVASVLRDKASQFEANRETSKSLIKDSFRELRKTISFIESELLNKVDKIFGNSIFAAALGEIEGYNGNGFIDYNKLEEASKEPVPPPIGSSDDEDFHEVQKAILEFKSSEKKAKSVPQNVIGKAISFDSVELSWSSLSDTFTYQVEARKQSDNTFSKVYEGNCLKRTVAGLEYAQIYLFRLRSVFGDGSVSWWSDVVTVHMPWGCAWKKCPDDVKEERVYSVDGVSPMIMTFTGNGEWDCTVIGNTPLPLNNVTSWNIKILKSKSNDGFGVFVGVAPSNINQNKDFNHRKCGWYLHCYDCSLRSGPPHNCKKKEYGPRKERGQYVHTGDSVGVVMDTTKGELSFVVDDVNLGVAFNWIPLDKPLVPCVVLCYQGDSVELII